MSIKKSFQDILENLDKEKKYINKEVFENTPQRIEDFYKEFFSGMYVNPYEFLQNTFDVPNNDLIIEKNINFYSMCEHHFLPFFGKVTIAYIPNGKIVGFGDIVKVIETYAKRPQLQERMTEQIALTIYKGLKCKGVYVLIEAEHTCMTMRGVKKPGAKIITTGTKGIFAEDSLKRMEVLTLIKNNSGDING
ncbi:GTP cyclohydrolase I FolE [Fusobacterium perfoetens]|uniref:GTP cyclohydrolase I FolE n=1 Tax=Fusobacterium perfoetens TaxID=852 RepID=UPI001F43A137|nr:GTP cyclohydrolase I FolE [Fusobacterium perfoetens]MCF2625595.1 GTP cyclohydrolase I FolE [Fusobacterium perfoetens]